MSILSTLQEALKQTLVSKGIFNQKLKKLNTKKQKYTFYVKSTFFFFISIFSWKRSFYMEFPLKMPKYVVFWQKCQNILFSFKMAKICKKYFLGKKIFLRALVMTMCIVYPFHVIMPEYPVINWIVQRHGQGGKFFTKDMQSYCIALPTVDAWH